MSVNKKKKQRNRKSLSRQISSKFPQQRGNHKNILPTLKLAGTSSTKSFVSSKDKHVTKHQKLSRGRRTHKMTKCKDYKNLNHAL